MELDAIKILGVNVSIVNPDLACRKIGQWIEDYKKTYVCVAPVSTIVDCQRDEVYRKIVNSAGMVTPDGMPLVWLAKRSGKKNIERTYGPDLLLAFCRYGCLRGYRHFFYGGSEETNKKLIVQLKDVCPTIYIAGTFAPGFLKVGEKEKDQVIDQINQAKPDILWVGLGSPKQDHWMSLHRPLLNVPVIAGVGAAFDFVAGVKQQAPRWMQRSGLEWLFRLCCEPQRLWKRYLLGNPYFLYLLMKNNLSKRS